MSFKVLEPEALKPRGLITATAEALSTCPPQAGFMQATHVLSRSQGFWENRAHGQGLELLWGVREYLQARSLLAVGCCGARCGGAERGA